eukprot:4362796-Pyramimonas_sp.AAC.1
MSAAKQSSTDCPCSSESNLWLSSSSVEHSGTLYVCAASISCGLPLVGKCPRCFSDTVTSTQLSAIICAGTAQRSPI